MRIKVQTFGNNRYEEEVYVYSLSYDCNLGNFVMESSGYHLLTDRKYQPKRIHAQWNIVFAGFEDREEARNFVAWLKEANQMAEESFTRMLD